VPNLDDAPFEERPGAPDGFRCRRAYLGRAAGAQRLGLSLWEVEPGEAAYPYHYHLGDEELLVVLEGSARLRTAEGWRDVVAGEVLSFPTGEGGGHQLVATGETPLRFLAMSTAGAPDLTVYPDSGKLGAYERRPEGLVELYRRDDAVDYWLGEEPPATR
jgi:uncharacterized cupin superfamily protein